MAQVYLDGYLDGSRPSDPEPTGWQSAMARRLLEGTGVLLATPGICSGGQHFRSRCTTVPAALSALAFTTGRTTPNANTMSIWLPGSPDL